MTDPDDAAQRRAWAALRDIIAGLSSGEDSEHLWKAATLKLSRVLDVPNCDVYRIDESEDLTCVASVCAGEWYPDYLGRRAELSLWTTDREALRTRRPVLVSSPDDPRLDEDERAEMRAWNESAALVVPMFVKEEMIGLVELGETREGHTLTSEQADVAESICQLIAMSIHDKDVMAAQEQYARELETLLASNRALAAVDDIGAALAAAADPAELWSSLALRLSELAGLPDCDVYRLADDGGLICLASVYDDEPCSDYLGLRKEQDLWGVDLEAVRTKQPVFIASPEDPRLGGAERDDMRRWREQAMLIVPLVARGEVIGLVEISETREDRTIAPEQISIVVSVCRLIAMSIHDKDVMAAQEQHARELEALLASSRELATLNDIGAALASTADPEELWSSMALRLSELVGLPDCDVYRLMDDGSLVCLASVYDDRPCSEHVDVRKQQDVWAVDREALSTKEPVFIASPADPRLGAAERDDMHSWREQAMLIVPLVARDEVIGLIEISETREDCTISPEQISTVVSVSRLIAMALHDADVMHAQEERARRLASLLESSRAVAGAATMEEALAVVTRCAGEVFGVSECVAYEHDPEHDAVVARAIWERTPSGWDRLGEPSPLAEDPMSRAVLESGRPYLGRLSDPQLDPVSRADLVKWGEQSCLTIPMRSSEGPMGLLNLWDKEQERTYTDGELALATSLAELAGEAVRGAKLLRRLRGLSESDSLTGLANHRKLHEFLALEQARAERYGSHFSLVMLDLDDFKLLNDTHGHPAGDAVLRQVATLLSKRTRAADVVSRYGGDEFLLVLPETTAAEAAALAENLRRALAEQPFVTAAGEQIPICASFGIAAYPDDLPDANGLVALADANLYASKRRGGDAVTGAAEERASGDAEGGTFSLFESLVTAVDNKDRYTRRHSEEVTAYALTISRALGLSVESQRILRVAALLHDVGKIGIPDRILRKPGSLTGAEYEIVKGHPALGETIIAAIPDVEEIRAAVGSHHERYDGTGYPHSLAREQIPLLGRIMAVADTYSAMTSNRPYRKALSREEAIAELRACSGTQFDPEIVETFTACLEQGADVEARVDAADKARSYRVA